MNREIRFRCKSNTLKRWCYGDLLQYNDGSVCIGVRSKTFTDDGYQSPEYSHVYYVDENTIGQFTGLYDKNGKEIYEGDILKWDKYDTSKHFQIEYNHGGFGYWYYGEFYLLGGNTNFSFKPFNKDKDFEIIGNIYDNPELLSDNKK